jgi:glycyl-tRNA synthetase
MGWKELEGVHNRSDYDLSRHMQYSGKDLQYIDQDDNNNRYTPYIIETSAGLTREVLMLLCDAYDEEYVGDGTADSSSEGTANSNAQRSNDDWRTVLRFHPNVAPITVAVLPLMKKDGLAELAQDIRKDLKADYATDYDQSGAIGRRYRRQDEAGTPFCVTVDYQSKEDGTVTLRYRDSMEQVRVPRAELVDRLRAEIKNYKRIK